MRDKKEPFRIAAECLVLLLLHSNEL